MTSATILRHRRDWAYLLNMLLALAAVVIAVIALATASDEVTQVISRSPSVTVAPSADTSGNDLPLDGCGRVGWNPC
jgi:hypothetical protein